ncbi:hypothetical protein RA280_19710 [Cupriavidus sp. CV2]|uniref:hypothetical protein n=1 Tax=Cupriavidus ulmosensis TaxID=3065913 RepID=UPI00296B0CCE|nr:hypothetical protein [Cupriavidus sp. CV2]MDW3683930.1 hypothetical protein [Cupriavidus sp. CV2]
MTPGKAEAKLRGQSAIAKKVFEMVPIQEAWSCNQILAALHRVTRSSMDYQIMQGCLVALKAAGLVREPKGGLFQRAEIKEKAEDKMANVTEAGEAAVQASGRGAKKSAIEILSGIASHLRMIASDIETAAIVIDEGIAEKDENLGKLKQLQSLLKSLT